MPVPRLCCSFIINSIISLQIYQPIWHRQQIKNQCLTCMLNMAMTYIYRVIFREAHCLFIRKSIITCPFCRFLQFIPRKKKSQLIQLVQMKSPFFWNIFWFLNDCSQWIKWASILMFIYFFSSHFSYPVGIACQIQMRYIRHHHHNELFHQIHYFT